MLEWLKTILGDAYNEETDKKISAEIGKEFVARSDFNAANEAKKTADAAVKDRDKQIEELKKVDPEKLQQTITDLQNTNTEAQKKYEADLKQIKQDSLLENRLIKEGAINVKAVKALLDPAKISLDGENLVGLDDQLKTLKEAEKWAFAPTGPGGKSGSRVSGGDPAGGETTTLADDIISKVYGGQQ